MLVNIILTVILALLAVMNFVHSAKLAKKKNWSTRKYRVVTSIDSLFAIIDIAAIVVIWSI